MEMLQDCKKFVEQYSPCVSTSVSDTGGGESLLCKHNSPLMPENDFVDAWGKGGA